MNLIIKKLCYLYLVLRLRFLLILFIHFSVSAQIDREFWFAVPEVTEDHADRPILLHISSQNSDALINISIPANNLIQPIEIILDANTSTSVDLTDWIDNLENGDYNLALGRGLFVQSDERITVYYEVLGSRNIDVLNTDIFVLKGHNALGTEFYTPFQNQHNNHSSTGIPGAWSSIDVVATEDNTTVTFELTSDAFGQIARIFIITLNRGETYSVRADSKVYDSGFSGSKVTSDKPIAITLKDDSIQKEGEGSHDLVGDQIVPIELIGTDYILSIGENYILATEDNTSIIINGNLEAVLDEGETYFVGNSENTFMESTNPVYLWQLIEKGGEYGGSLIPHIKCTGSYKVNFSRATDEPFSLILIVKSGGENGFLLNGNAGAINAIDFEDVIGTNYEWVIMKKNFTQNIIPVQLISQLENTTQPFHLGIINGSGSTGNRYGYFSNYNILDLGIDFNACDNTILQVENGLDSYEWSTGALTSSIDIDTSGVYWVKGVEGNCSTTDTIVVEIKPGVSFELAKDTFMCDENGLTLSGPTGDLLTYEWSTGHTTKDIMIDSAAVYGLIAKNAFGCYDRKFINVMDLVFDVENVHDTLLCEEEAILKVEDNSETIYWSLDGDTLSDSASVMVSKQGIYYLYRRNECGVLVDTFFIETRNFVFPNIFTPNGDLINDNLEIELGRGVWNFDLFNRWGKPVYQNEEFEGNLNTDALNDGLYYYSLFDDLCEKNYKGWIQMLR